MKEEIKSSLKGATKEEKIKEIEERIFLIEMADTLSTRARETIDILEELKKELEAE